MSFRFAFSDDCQSYINFYLIRLENEAIEIKPSVILFELSEREISLIYIRSCEYD